MTVITIADHSDHRPAAPGIALHPARHGAAAAARRPAIHGTTFHVRRPPSPDAGNA